MSRLRHLTRPHVSARPAVASAVASAAPSAAPTAGPARILTRRWSGSGCDRIYVERDGVQLGYYDVTAATIRCEDMSYRDAIARALRREASAARTSAAAPIDIAWPAAHVQV